MTADHFRRLLGGVTWHLGAVLARLPRQDTDPGAVDEVLWECAALSGARRRATAELLGPEDRGPVR